MGEVRYTQLMKSFPQQADELFEAAKESARWRYRSYKRMTEATFSVPPIDNELITETADKLN